MKYLLPILLVLCSCSQQHSEPPPEFTIVCDRQGHYGMINTGDNVSWAYVVSTDFDNREFMSKQQAVDHAWNRHEIQTRTDANAVPAPPRRDWRLCDEPGAAK